MKDITEEHRSAVRNIQRASTLPVKSSMVGNTIEMFGRGTLGKSKPKSGLSSIVMKRAGDARKSKMDSFVSHNFNFS